MCLGAETSAILTSYVFFRMSLNSFHSYSEKTDCCDIQSHISPMPSLEGSNKAGAKEMCNSTPPYCRIVWFCGSNLENKYIYPMPSYIYELKYSGAFGATYIDAAFGAF